MKSSQVRLKAGLALPEGGFDGLEVADIGGDAAHPVDPIVLVQQRYLGAQIRIGALSEGNPLLEVSRATGVDDDLVVSGETVREFPREEFVVGLPEDLVGLEAP